MEYSNKRCFFGNHLNLFNPFLTPIKRNVDPAPTSLNLEIHTFSKTKSRRNVQEKLALKKRAIKI